MACTANDNMYRALLAATELRGTAELRGYHRQQRMYGTVMKRKVPIKRHEIKGPQGRSCVWSKGALNMKLTKWQCQTTSIGTAKSPEPSIHAKSTRLRT